MLERLRDQPDDPHAELLIPHDNDTGSESDRACEGDETESLRETDTTHSLDLSDNPHVLEELLSSLDEPGRKALFTIFNSAMENACAGGQCTPTGEDAKGSMSSASPPESRKEEAAADITSILEMLAEEIEISDLSYNDILVRLPECLRCDFEKRLREGSLDRLVLVWTPWWQPANPAQDSSPECVQPPAPLPPLPSPDQLVVPIHVPRKKGSPFLKHNLIDILVAYALSMRLCNGELWGDACAAKTFWRTSTVLAVDSRYASTNEVCDAVAKNITREENHALATQSLYDAADILSGGSDWVSRALYECQILLEAGLRVAGMSKSEIRKRVCKIGFFVSWSLCQESVALQDVAREVISFADLERGHAEEVKTASRIMQASRTRRITVLESHV